MTTTPEPHSVKSLFGDRNFRRYIFADNLTLMGDCAFFIFLLWAGEQLSDNPAVVGGLLTAHILPRIALKLYGGKVADRVEPQRILFWCNLVQASALGGISLWSVLADDKSVFVLYGLAIVIGVVNAFLIPATVSAVPRIASDDQLQAANRVVETLGYVAQFGGIGLAGVLLQFGGITFAAAGCGGMYLLSGILFAGVRVKFHIVADEAADNGAIKQGLRYVWRTPVLRGSMLLVFFTSLAVKGPINIGLLLLITEKLGLGPLLFSIAYMFYSVGGVVSAAVLGGKKFKSPGRLMVLEFVVMGIVFMSLALATNFWLVAIGFVLLGGLSSLSTVVGKTWQQKNTSKSKLGIVAATRDLSEIALEPVSRGLTGVLAGLSLEGMLLLSGAYLLVSSGIVAKFNPVLIRREH